MYCLGYRADPLGRRRKGLGQQTEWEVKNTPHVAKPIEATHTYEEAEEPSTGDEETRKLA